MPYDERLVERIQKVLVSRKGVTQKKMFGGLAFMLNGNMCCGVIKDFLVLRLGLELSQKALSEPHTRLFDLSGRVEKGIILVTPLGYETEDALRKWVERAVDFTSSLQPKAPKDHKTSRQGT